MIKFKVQIGDENTEYTTSSITKDTAIDLLTVAIIVLNLTHAPKWHIEVRNPTDESGGLKKS